MRALEVPKAHKFSEVSCISIEFKIINPTILLFIFNVKFELFVRELAFRKGMAFLQK